jgi:zinc/manganese transport system substrate-binding protein
MRRVVTLTLLTLGLATTAACGDASEPSDARPTVVVSFPVLASVVRDVVGDAARVQVLMPNGIDPHDWSPSAKDVAALDDADLVMVNGLGLEEGLEDALAEAERAGVAVFEATDHVTLRELGADPHAEDGTESTDDHGTEDPHVWMDPLAMRDVAAALGTALTDAGIGATGATATVAALEALHRDAGGELAALPHERRKLVTGHESMGYFADRYGFELIGAVVPGLTSQAEVSAADLAALEATIEREGVPAIFTEMGTPAKVVQAIAGDTGVAVVELATHTLPADGTYRTFLMTTAKSIADALG